MYKVMVVEDDLDTRDYLVDTLNSNQFSALGANETNEAFEHMSNNHFDLILLDQNLPGRSGFDFIRLLRGIENFKNIPVVMVTGLDCQDSKIVAFEMGADDYVVKPVMPKELVARLKAILRRTNPAKSSENILQTHSLNIDVDAHRVLVDGREVPLTLTEFKILCELVRGEGRVLSRDNLREKALGNLNVTDRTIDVHMASLRKKIPVIANQIKTVRGVGYRYGN